MKSELEQQDIEIIAQRVVQLLRPLLAHAGRVDTAGDTFKRKSMNLAMKWRQLGKAILPLTTREVKSFF